MPNQNHPAPKPKPMGGLRHTAIFVQQLEACTLFYTKSLGMSIEWQPDNDNVYLRSKNDNLALHRAPPDFNPAQHQRLDHIGFAITEPEQVDVWYHYLEQQGVPLKGAPRTHRDGARSFYCVDPDGTFIQMIYHPSFVSTEDQSRA